MRKRSFLSASSRVGTAAVLGALACDDPVRIPPPPSTSKPIPISVRWEHPFPQSNDLRRMWGFPDGTLYAVGDAGTVVHYDGAFWTIVDVPTREDLHGIWASSPTNVYAAGFKGSLLHFDGVEWIRVRTPSTTDLYAVWASASDDVFIAGAGGTVWNLRNGKSFAYHITSGGRFRAMWGYGHNEVYVGGSNSALFRFDGSAWVRIDIGVTLFGDIEIRDMWGPAPDSLSFVADRNIIWFEGTTWNAIATISPNVYGQWGFSLDDQVAVSAGTSTHLVAGEYVFYSTTTEEPLFDVWGRAGDDCFAVGRYGNIAHFDGNGWSAINRGPTEDLRDMNIVNTHALAVGAKGTILRRVGSTWNDESVGVGYDLSGVWVDEDGLAFAVGRYSDDGFQWRQAVLTNESGVWTNVGAVGDASRYFDVWGSSSTDVHVVGWGGEMVHYNGSTWSEAMPDSGDVAMLRCVSGTSSSNIIAVGRTNDLDGFIARYDGNSWQNTVIANVEDLNGVWVENAASAFAVGNLGVILQFDGSSWKRMSSGTSEALFSVDGTSASNVYAVGWAGTILHYDGEAWHRLVTTIHRNLNLIWARSNNEIYFAGEKGAILLFDGETSSHAVTEQFAMPSH